jgi:hypothetical protein
MRTVECGGHATGGGEEASVEAGSDDQWSERIAVQEDATEALQVQFRETIESLQMLDLALYWR